MQPALVMAEFVRDFWCVHPPLPTVTGFWSAVPLPRGARLVVRVLEHRLLVSVGCYRADWRGLPVADPEIVFYRAEQAHWWPIERTRARRGKTVVATVVAGGVALLDPAGQATLAAEADAWAQQLRAQLQVAYRPADECGQQPSWEILMDWLDEERGCEATDGCWLAERDGVCAHGHPSWLVALDLL
jgi:hypothetical protein